MGFRVAVVGAGYAGMAAAVELAARGACPVVYESGPVAGGRARRIASRGETLDNGQHVLIGAYAELLRLMAIVGVGREALLRQPLDLRYAEGFRLRALRLPAPAGVAAGMLLAHGAPLRERLAALRFVGAMKRAGFRMDEDTTVAALLERHGQTGCIARFLWRPLCVSALNTPPQRASANAFLAVLRDALLGPRGAADLLLPRVDLSRLFPEPAAAYVARHGGEVRLRSPVRDLAALLGQYGTVVVAVGPHQLKALLPALDVEREYQPIVTCYLQYPESTRLPCAMLGLAEGLVQWVFDRGALCGERGRLACVISAEGGHRELAQEELAAACHRELSRAVSGLPAPAWSRVIIEKRATVTCSPGPRGVAGSRLPPGVHLAGDYTDPEYPPTLEAAVRSGVRAARAVLEVL